MGLTLEALQLAAHGIRSCLDRGLLPVPADGDAVEVEAAGELEAEVAAAVDRWTAHPGVRQLAVLLAEAIAEGEVSHGRARELVGESADFALRALRGASLLERHDSANRWRPTPWVWREWG